MKWLVILLTSWTAASALQQPPRIGLALAREYFDEARHVAASESARLWGMEVYGPMLLVDPVSRQLVANLPDSAGLLAATDGVFTGQWPRDEPVANTAVTFGGRRYAMILWPLPGERATRLRLMFHESFHRIQSRLSLPGSNPANLHLNTTHGRTWTRLEWRAMAEALLSEGNARLEALRDARAFREVRLAKDSVAAREEQALLMSEGVAEYTGWMLNGESDSLRRRHVALALMARERQEGFARSFAYAAGPAYGVLLDLSGMAWRPGLTAASELPEMVYRAYGIGPADTVGIERRSERYGAVIVRAEEQDQAERRAATEREYRASFLDGPVLTLVPTDKFRYSFDPNGISQLSGVGTVFRAAEVTDAWGVLRVTRGGVLMRRDPSERIVSTW